MQLLRLTVIYLDCARATRATNKPFTMDLRQICNFRYLYNYFYYLIDIEKIEVHERIHSYLKSEMRFFNDWGLTDRIIKFVSRL